MLSYAMDLALPPGVKLARELTEWLEGRWKVNGKPEFDPKSADFWEMTYDIIYAWRKGWPQELSDWLHDRQIDLEIERDLKASAKSGFKKTMAFPPTLFRLLKAYWPQGRLQDRTFSHMFMKRYPMFRNSNYT